MLSLIHLHILEKNMARVLNQDVQLTVRTNRRDRDRLHALAQSHNMKLSTFLRVLPDMRVLPDISPKKIEAA